MGKKDRSSSDREDEDKKRRKAEKKRLKAEAEAEVEDEDEVEVLKEKKKKGKRKSSGEAENSAAEAAVEEQQTEKKKKKKAKSPEEDPDEDEEVKEKKKKRKKERDPEEDAVASSFDFEAEETGESTLEAEEAKPKAFKGKKLRKLMSKLSGVLGLPSDTAEEDDEGDDLPWEQFPGKEEVKRLKATQHEKFVDRASALCERAIILSSKLCQRYGGKSGKEGICGIAVQGVSASSQRVARKAARGFEPFEMWRQVSALSRRCCNSALKHARLDLNPGDLQTFMVPEEDDFEDVDGENVHSNPKQEVEDEEEASDIEIQDAEPESEELATEDVAPPNETAKHPGFKEWYMSQFVDAFSDDLDAIRQQEGLDTRGVSSLIDAIAHGIDLIPQLEKSLSVERLQGSKAKGGSSKAHQSNGKKAAPTKTSKKK